MKRLEILLLAVLGGFAVVFLFLSKDYNPTAALFPRYVAIASLVFLVGTRIAGRERGLKPATTSSPEHSAEHVVAGFSPRSLPRILAVQGAYVFLIYLLGFFPATLLFLSIAPLQLGFKRRGIVLVHGIAMTLALAGSFLWLFEVQLPAGALWNLW